LALEPEHGLALALRGAAVALRSHQGEEAQEWFERALAVSPADATVRSYYAVCCLLPMGLLDEARTDLEASVGMDPHAPLPRTVLALAHWLGGDAGEASRHATTAIVQSPGSPEPVLLLACSCLLTADPWRAVSRLQPLLDSLAEPGLAPAVLALAAARSGRTRDALQYAEQVELIAQSRFVLPSRRAWAQLARGRLDLAQLHLAEAVRQQELVTLFANSPLSLSAAIHNSRPA
jgi:tetratricopeptide (TPR) repeat protein